MRQNIKVEKFLGIVKVQQLLERWSSHICKSPYAGSYLPRIAKLCSKYEHSKTFSLIYSGSSNVVWAPDETAPNAPSRSTGAGRAVVSANEEVLCWDVKKGELLSRWRDVDCNAEVTAIARSKADRDIYAVG